MFASNPSITKTKKKHRYKILCIKKIPKDAKPEKAAQIILEHVGLPEDQFRLGNTKVQNNHNNRKHF